MCNFCYNLKGFPETLQSMAPGKVSGDSLGHIHVTEQRSQTETGARVQDPTVWLMDTDLCTCTRETFKQRNLEDILSERAELKTPIFYSSPVT